MNLALRPDVHFCIANDQPCFLHLAEDRYYCLPELAGATFLDIVRGKVEPDLLLSTVSAKTAAKLFTTSCSLNRPTAQTTSQRALDSLTNLPLPKADWTTVASAGIAYFAAGPRLKRLGIKAIVNDLQRRKAACCGEKSGDDLAQSAGDFLRTKRLLATHDQCLRWSVAMSTFLGARGYFPELVIGVKMKPFGAHAWVQDGSVVLSDALDNVLPYTPILVV